MLAFWWKVHSFRSLSAVVLLSVVGVAGQSANVSAGQTKTLLGADDAPQAILTACASYARSMLPEERAFLMVRIATIASTGKLPQSTKWAREAFLAGSDLQESWNKIALQKNALVALASTRSAEALRLLGTLPAPKATSEARIDEDPRADAARVIFESAYRKNGEKALSQMIQVSSYLGRTGEYPYVAWGIVLPKLAKKHPGTFGEVITTAVHFYGDAEGRTIIQDDDYLQMVDALHTTADSYQMKMAVTVGIDHLETAKTPKNEKYMDVVGQGLQRTAFDNRSKALLYRWLPLVKEFDSADYEDLTKKLKVMASPQSTQHASLEIVGNTQNITPAVQQKAQDRLQAEIVENDASNDADTAIRESTAIGSFALRSDALAKGAMNVPAKAMPERTKLLAESRRDLNQVNTKDAAYLQAIADLAYAYDQSKMRQTALSLVHDGLEQGSEILDESADAQQNTPIMLLGGYDSLAKLTGIGMNLDPNFTLARVQSLRDFPLKVNLLVDIAESLGVNKIQ